MLHKQEIIGSEVEDTDPINVNDSPSQRRIIRKVELNPPFSTPLLPTRSTFCEAVTGGQAREAGQDRGHSTPQTCDRLLFSPATNHSTMDPLRLFSLTITISLYRPRPWSFFFFKEKKLLRADEDKLCRFCIIFLMSPTGSWSGLWRIIEASELEKSHLTACRD